MISIDTPDMVVIIAGYSGLAQAFQQTNEAFVEALRAVLNKSAEPDIWEFDLDALMARFTDVPKPARSEYRSFIDGWGGSKRSYRPLAYFPRAQRILVHCRARGMVGHYQDRQRRARSERIRRWRDA